MDEICATCKYNTYDYDEGEFVCSCEDSEMYGIYTFVDDGCECFEDKNGAY